MQRVERGGIQDEDNKDPLNDCIMEGKATSSTVPSSDDPQPLLNHLSPNISPPKASSCNSEDSCIGISEDEEEEEDHPSLDQRHLNLVHEELEKLNIATDVINKLEVQLDRAREQFREAQAHWSERLKELSKKYGSAITKARPFYEARLQERRLREESQRAAIRFERASNLLAVAKQQVTLTQDSLSRQTSVHPECLEVLNHHIRRVSEAEGERVTAEEEHRSLAERMLALSSSIMYMEKEHRSAIKKSRTYFDERLEFSRVLERQKQLILQLEAEVRQKKCDYTTSLRNLERISDSIHEERSIGGQSVRSVDRRTDTSIEVSSSSSCSVAAVSEGPPPYQPTAPPPYDAFPPFSSSTTNQQEQDEVGVLSLLEECSKGGEESVSSPHLLGSGVILIAQQLMDTSKEMRDTKNGSELGLSGCEMDVSYRTCLPEGMKDTVMTSLSADESEVSSLASSRITSDDEKLIGMLRSHSSIISEINGCANRVESLLKRSVSEAES